MLTVSCDLGFFSSALSRHRAPFSVHSFSILVIEEKDFFFVIVSKCDIFGV